MLSLTIFAAGLMQLAPGLTTARSASDAVILQKQPATGCSVSADAKQRILTLSPREFDQNASLGWRQYASRECYEEAAMLIESYAKSVTDLRWRAALQFHNFQMLAFAGKTDRAVASLDIVERLDRERNADQGWSLYVAGTKAFLKRNKQDLIARSAELAAFANLHGPIERIARLNGSVLLGLIRCFDQPYRSAYGSLCIGNSTTRGVIPSAEGKTAF